MCPIRDKRIVVCNVWGFGDNAKYVTEELARRKEKLQKKIAVKKSNAQLSNKRNKDKRIPKGMPVGMDLYEIIFITNHPETAYAPKGVKVIKTNSMAAIKALATAEVWVDNNRKESYIRKRKGQYYIQTWHGGIALKKIEKDYEHLSTAYQKNAKRDSQMADLYVSNSTFCTNMFKKSFWYNGEIVEWGSPRNDILLAPPSSALSDIKKRLGVEKDVKICIYAPTYREGNNTRPYVLDYEKLLHVLEKRFGGKWVITVRLHPLVSEQSNFLKYNDHIINASQYRDIYELMAVGDVMITDYSNIMFEFSFMKKPVFLYAADEVEYTKDRGFYFDYTTLPFMKANSGLELFENIENYQKEEDQEKVQDFLNTLTIYENGDASKKVVDQIMKVVGIKE